MGKQENLVQKSIKEYLEWGGWTVFRINNAGSFNKKREQYIFHGTAGVCDLIALKKGRPALFIECKSEKGKPSKAQKDFLDLINNTVGTPIGICANSLENFANEIMAKGKRNKE